MKKWMMLLVIVLAGAWPLVVQGASPIYVNALSGSDGYDGEAAVWDGTHGPKQTIQAGINVVDADGIVNVATGMYGLSSTVLVNKSVTLRGAGIGNTIVQGTQAIGYFFNISAANVTIDQFEIQKVDVTGVHNLILVNGNNCTISNNLIYGPDPGTPWSVNGIVSRALEVAGGLSGLTISNNTITTLRQPAYINPGTSGMISGNKVSRTRGWVVDRAQLTFSANTWGMPMNEGAEIAILAGTEPAWYLDPVTLSAANDNAYISAQHLSPVQNGRAISYVDLAAAPGGFGNQSWPYQTINTGYANCLGLGTVDVAAGTYAESITANRPAAFQGHSGTILLGPGSGNGFLIQTPDITIDTFEITNFSIGVRSYGGPSVYTYLRLYNNNIHHNLSVGIQLVYDTFYSVDIANCQINNTTAGSGISIANNTAIRYLTLNNSTISGNRDHGIYINNGTTATLSNILIHNCNITNQVNYGGISLQQAVIGEFSLITGQLSGNKGMGMSVNQNASTFNALNFVAVHVHNNGESGILLGGGSTTGTLSTKGCSFQNNGWEHFDLSGGWFGAFNVTGAVLFQNNTFYGSPWASLYIGNAGTFASPPVLRYNAFLSNNNAVVNANAIVVDAELNYWNSAHGPSDGAGTTEVALGDPDPGVVALKNALPGGLLGGSVTDNTVDYFPWLASPVTFQPSQHFSAVGGTDVLYISAPAGYAWTAVSNDPWITINSGTPGSGLGSINYTVAPNPNPGMRTGTITIDGLTFTVTQDGATLSLIPLFYASPTHGWPGMVVQFEDHSIGNPTAWMWLSGDGQTSSLRNPQFIYTKPGVYDVTLAITVGTTVYTYTEKALIVVYGRAPLCRATLELVESSDSFVKEPWENAIDDDVSGVNATATVKGDPPYAIFQFKDSTEKQIESVNLLTDTHVGHPERWASRFEVLVSTAGLQPEHFTSILHAVRDGGGWEDYDFTPVAAKYIKLVIHEPASGWCQIGEFQVCPVRTYADPLLSSLEITSPHVANGLDVGLLTLKPVAADGAPISGLTFDDFKIIDWSGTLKWDALTETTTPGVYTAAFTSVAAGEKRIDCYVNGIYLGTAETTFTHPKVKFAPMILVQGSATSKGQGWDNALDGDTDGWDGTVTAKGDPAWAIFAFADGSIKSLSILKLMTENGVNLKYRSRMIERFHLMVSTSGTADADFVTIYDGLQKTGAWQKHAFTSSPAKYVKLVIDQPAQGWSQLVELEFFASDDAAAQFAAKAQSEPVALAAVFELSVRNYPNPFNPETTVEYTLPQRGDVQVAVYNLLGQQVRMLASGIQESGRYQVRWDGRDGTGQKAPSGIYLLRIQSGSQAKVHRMVMLK